VVDYPFEQANIILQLRSWDARAMKDVLDAVAAFKEREKLTFEIKPAGSAYFNLVWNQEVLKDMIVGFGLALLVVFAILALDFRSLKWAMVAYVPLLLTVALIFGVIGFVGKDFDMPVAVLSCLSLGMAVDFAIHFVTRYRQRLEASTEVNLDARVNEALRWVVTWPGKGIVRNAALFAVAFSVMIFAPLTPYMTVGVFIVAMMVLSALATLSLLPALIKTFKLQ
jgi:predicted RND superfamily exporter protein